MSLSFPHKSQEYFDETYNTFGILFFVPIYFNILYDEEYEEYWIDQDMEEANWVPKPLFWMAKGLAYTVAYVEYKLGFRALVPVFVVRTTDDE